METAEDDDFAEEEGVNTCMARITRIGRMKKEMDNDMDDTRRWQKGHPQNEKHFFQFSAIFILSL
jgi:hypothetical protein